MANINSELLAFKNATYGEDIRDAMISSINAINEELINTDGSIQTNRKIIEENLKTASGGFFTDGGDITFSQLASASKVAGVVYRITDGFTTTADFIDGAGKTYPAGTNVYWNAAGTKWKCLQGRIDEQLASFKTTMQQSFQDGVDGIYDAIVAQGTTPTSKSLSNVKTGIGTLSTNRYNTGYNTGVTATKIGTATADKVLTGYTFTSENVREVGTSGTMRDCNVAGITCPEYDYGYTNDRWYASQVINASNNIILECFKDVTFQIPKGYYDGNTYMCVRINFVWETEPGEMLKYANSSPGTVFPVSGGISQPHYWSEDSKTIIL